MEALLSTGDYDESGLFRKSSKRWDSGSTVKEDVMNALLTKYKQPSIEEKLVILGKLTAYTKQLDMAMFNDAVTDMYIDQFIKAHIQK